MTVQLDEARRRELQEQLQILFRSQFDEQLSDYRAEEIVSLMLRTLAPAVYNQAVQDARAFLQARLDDLDGEVYAPEER